MGFEFQLEQVLDSLDGGASCRIPDAGSEPHPYQPVKILGQGREGGYLGVISISIGFITNMLFARNLLVHGFVGALIGWIMLAPLAVAWKDLKLNKTTKN